MFRELTERVKDDMYVHDLVTGGGEGTSDRDKLKGDSVNLFQRGGFKLHKWHSNKQARETNDSVNENELNFAKQHLGTKPKETKILGPLGTKRKIPSLFKYRMLTKMQQNEIYLVHWPQSMTH